MSVTAVASASTCQCTQIQPTQRPTPNDAATTGASNADSTADRVQISAAAKALQVRGGQSDPDHDGN